jgi:Ca-activated chloride channel family protein
LPTWPRSWFRPPRTRNPCERRSARTTSIGTAIGSATLKAIDAIAEINPDVLPSGLNLRIDGSPAEADGEPYVPDIIVVLTDGANTRGPHPLDAARQAADRRVRVFTIGFGTTTPRTMVCSPAQMGVEVGGGGFGGGFGGGGGGGFRRFLLLDERTLQGVADLTGGTYYRAESAEQLLEVFSSLPAQITLQKQDVELSAGFSALGALLFTLALALSLLWTRLA